MKPWHCYTLTITLGLAVGASLAVYRVRGGLAAGQITNGPWATAKTYGTKDADALTRARVALSGLLALPAKEAMYFTAKTDSAGRPLDGKHSYMLAPGWIEGRWWSVTAYDSAGRLIPNTSGKYSYGGAITPTRYLTNTAAFVVGPPSGSEFAAADPTRFIDLGVVRGFELTLRVYQPSRALLAAPDKAVLPSILCLDCGE